MTRRRLWTALVLLGLAMILAGFAGLGLDFALGDCSGYGLCSVSPTVPLLLVLVLQVGGIALAVAAGRGARRDRGEYRAP